MANQAELAPAEQEHPEQAEQAGPPICRICLGTREEAPAGAADVLCEPCGCRGTMRYAHVSCVMQQQAAAAHVWQNPHRCSVCRGLLAVPDELIDALAAALGDVLGPRARLPRAARSVLRWLARGERPFLLSWLLFDAMVWAVQRCVDSICEAHAATALRAFQERPAAEALLRDILRPRPRLEWASVAAAPTASAATAAAAWMAEQAAASAASSLVVWATFHAERARHVWTTLRLQVQGG